MNNTYIGLSILNFLLVIGATAGGIASFRHGFAKTAQEVQAHVIEALKFELEALYAKIATLESDHEKLQSIYDKLIESLERQGIYVTIQGDMLHIINKTTGFKQKSRISNAPKASAEEV